jgi:hypothetical protein
MQINARYRSLALGALGLVAALGSSRSSAAAPVTPIDAIAAPVASPVSTPVSTPPAEANPSGASTNVPVRFGVLGGVGFPRPLAIEAMVEVANVVAVGFEYGTLPGVTIDGVHAGLWSLAADARVFPFHGVFFLGLRAGRQHVGASTTLSVESLGSATEILALDSWFVNPRVGFLWTSKEGLSLGVEAGVQFPVSPGVSSTLPLSLYPAAQRTVEVLGSSVIPTVDLLRVGLLL